MEVIGGRSVFKPATRQLVDQARQGVYGLFVVAMPCDEGVEKIVRYRRAELRRVIVGVSKGRARVSMHANEFGEPLSNKGLVAR